MVGQEGNTLTQEQSGFSTFGLDPRVNIGVRAAGYEQPTPIQEQTIAEGMTGRHILGLAQTGTGKTAAFVLPVLHRLLEGQGPEGQRHGGRGAKRKTRALVVAPTRELAEQINDEFRTLGQATGLRSATVYGGVGFQPQIEALRGRADIIVACPGRLIDHMERGHANLSNVEILVLDEADHMFDMGFLPPIRRILKAIPDTAQRMLFSATMPSEVAHLADEVLTDPLRVEVDRQAPAENIEHALMAIDEKVKSDLLLHMLKTQDHRSTLVFTRTKHRAKKLAGVLDNANIFVAEIQGNLSQRRRQEALDGFKDGTYHVLVATDIAARGIDVARVSHVINFDFPDTPEAYTHRIGRTGRARRSGKAITFVTEYDFANVQQLERKLGMRINRERAEGFAGPVDALDNLRPGSGGGQGRGGARGGNRSGGRSGGRGGNAGGRQGGQRRSGGERGHGERMAAGPARSEGRGFSEHSSAAPARSESRSFGAAQGERSDRRSPRAEGQGNSRPAGQGRSYGQRASGRPGGSSYGASAGHTRFGERGFGGSDERGPDRSVERSADRNSERGTDGSTPRNTPRGERTGGSRAYGSHSDHRGAAPDRRPAGNGESRSQGRGGPRGEHRQERRADSRPEGASSNEGTRTGGTDNRRNGPGTRRPQRQGSTRSREY